MTNQSDKLKHYPISSYSQPLKNSLATSAISGFNDWFVALTQSEMSLWQGDIINYDIINTAGWLTMSSLSLWQPEGIQLHVCVCLFQSPLSGSDSLCHSNPWTLSNLLAHHEIVLKKHREPCLTAQPGH